MPRMKSLALALTALALVAGCATPEPVGPAAKEEIVAVTASNHLLRFNAGQGIIRKFHLEKLAVFHFQSKEIPVIQPGKSDRIDACERLEKVFDCGERNFF